MWIRFYAFPWLFLIVSCSCYFTYNAKYWTRFNHYWLDSDARSTAYWLYTRQYFASPRGSRWVTTLCKRNKYPHFYHRTHYERWSYCGSKTVGTHRWCRVTIWRRPKLYVSDSTNAQKPFWFYRRIRNLWNAIVRFARGHEPFGTLDFAKRRGP